MSALGQKRTYAVQNAMSALPPKADIDWSLSHVCFVPIADIIVSTTYPHREFCRGCDLQHRSLDAPDPYFEYQADGPLLGEWSMRIPLLSYFLVAGTVLFGALVLVGNKLEPKPLPVSQMVGVPAPFKAPPEDVQSIAGAVNFDRQNL
jgi:hypothetical protein